MKHAVILFNLGGPDSPEAVKPFLFNLFNDPAIITLPNPFRYLIAKLISGRRTKEAQHIYSQIGNRSPILPNTEKQARALEAVLGPNYKVFIAMRYWHPRAEDVLKEVLAWGPDSMTLLPLYPQYSTTTSESSIKEWKELTKDSTIPQTVVCCFPKDPSWINAQAQLIQDTLKALPNPKNLRLLFSAHGLPQKIIDSGDPYQYQVESTVESVMKLLKDPIEHQISYQSRVGPLKWIGPSTEDEIKRAGGEKKSLLVIPIAFVSDHSETLVELDIEYEELAKESGVPHYSRVPVVSDHPVFIEGLKNLVLNPPTDICCGDKTRCYRKSFKD